MCASHLTPLNISFSITQLWFPTLFCHLSQTALKSRLLFGPITHHSLCCPSISSQRLPCHFSTALLASFLLITTSSSCHLLCFSQPEAEVHPLCPRKSESVTVNSSYGTVRGVLMCTQLSLSLIWSANSCHILSNKCLAQYDMSNFFSTQTPSPFSPRPSPEAHNHGRISFVWALQRPSTACWNTHRDTKRDKVRFCTLVLIVLLKIRAIFED